MNKIVFLPLDERPCNYLYPSYIGDVSAIDMKIVPKEIMGSFKKEADVEEIWQWTRKEANDADYLIVSMDLFIYGGIVPSRLHHLTEATCKERIDRLRILKSENPKLQILAYQLITRAPARNGSGEEPDYYEDYGYRIFRYGVITDKEQIGAVTEEELLEKEEICKEVPIEHLEDFLKRRRQNYDNNISTISLVKDGIIDFMIIPLDDCKEYGYAPAERKKISSYNAKHNLFSKILMYPGADEVGCTLLVRAINQVSGIKPKVYIDYSSLRGQFQIPTYEDRSIGETVQYQLLAAGCEHAENSQEADCVLLVNPPTLFSLRLEKELLTDEIIMESERNLIAFASRIRKYRERGLLCGLADCAIPNGADRALMQVLYEQNLLYELVTYSGWNTSSNTLGTAIAHLVSHYTTKSCERLGERERTISSDFRYLRYMEDWGYMACIRREVTDSLKDIDPDIGFLYLKDKEPVVREIVKDKLYKFESMYFPEENRSIDVTMPWNRMFEIELTLKS